MRFVFRLAALGLLLSLTGPRLFAQAADMAATESFTLQPGGKATVSYEAFCLDFGKTFPARVNAPASVSDAKIQQALHYALTKGYQSSEPLELQYALWELTEAQDVPASGQVAAEIKAATGAPPASSAVSVLDAVKDGRVRLTMGSWSPTGDKVDLGKITDNYYGSGQFMLENTSQEAIELTVPVGVVFPTPDPAAQNMVGYATDVAVDNPRSQMPETGAAEDASRIALLAAAFALLIGGGLLIRARRAASQAR